MNELLEIDAGRTVVLTIDMQNDYLDGEIGTDHVAPDEAKRVINQTRRLLDFARSQGLPVIHAYVKRRPGELERGFVTSPMGHAGRRAGLTQNAQGKLKGPDRIDGTPQAELHPALVAAGDYHVTTKRVFDSYHGTDLDTLMNRVFAVQTVILAGINTDTCVYHTTFSTAARGYQPVVISDCVASARGRDHHWMALELMSRSIAWVLTVDELLAKIRAARGGLKRADREIEGRHTHHDHA